MRESSKAALCGIVSALAVVIMLSTYLSPFLVYTAPAFSGLLILLILNEIGYGWAIGTYFTISLLSVFVIADKESAVFFTMFFGYYPILGYFLSKHVNNKFLKTILKYFVFNIACVASFFICMYVFGVSYDDIFSDGFFLTVIFILMLNIFFAVYDLLLIRIQELYIKKFQKRFRKLFNIK